MKGLAKILKTRLEKSWSTEFPGLEVIRRNASGSIVFCCNKYFTSRGLMYLFHIAFSSRRPGRFSVSIGISKSEVNAGPLQGSNFEPSKLGEYPICAFQSTKDFWWHLEDIESRERASLAQWGVPGLTSLVNYNDNNRWRPSSYALPIEDIVDEAICDLNQRLKKFVFPKLQIECSK